MNGANDCFHLSLETVLKIHDESIRRFGGTPKLRSRDLLESAVAAPQAVFGAGSVFGDGIEIAAAYLFYLCSNHPFVDGNKRTAPVACLVFLKLNGAVPAPDSGAWESLTLDVAGGRIDRDTTTARLRDLVETP
ncbi:MAG: type II toxin-antitoxin system death-on-curing family toxin [Verrucomicrobiales bacterium]